MRTPGALLPLLLLAPLGPAASGCGDARPPAASQSRAPALGSADGTDAADRGCRIVLRDVGRVAGAMGGYQSDCSAGTCYFVWQGTLDVQSGNVANGATPIVLYHLAGAAQWYEVAASPIDGAGPGFGRYQFRLFDHTVGPGLDLDALNRTDLELVPALRQSGGGRLFDHNRHAGDFENYHLVLANSWAIASDPAVCPAPIVRRPGWMGNLVVKISPGGGSACDGAEPLGEGGFRFDTWARERADRTNLCFEVWLRGTTDRDNPDLWRQLDVQVHYRFAPGAFTTDYVSLDGRVGNNARYAVDLRPLDPFRPNHCPGVPTSFVGSGADRNIQARLELHFTANGAELRPGGPGTLFQGGFFDYPSNPWRDANCPPPSP
jgi:hypothetical protein